MKEIKGLMIKDLLQLKSYKRTLFVFVFVFIASSIAQEHTRNVLAVMMTLGLGMFGIATFSYDEMAKADKYILTLPVTKKEVVLSKYVLVISATIIGAILGIIVTIIVTFAMQKQLPDILELLSLGVGAIFGVGTVEAIQIPCIYKYGAEKGRIQIFIFILIFALIIGAIVFVGEKLSISFSTNNWVEILLNFLPIVLILVTAVIYYTSYQISYKIYQKKSF